MNTQITLGARTKTGDIAKFVVQLHDGFPEAGQPDLFGFEPYGHERAIADITDLLTQSEENPRVVLACIPGGKN